MSQNRCPLMYPSNCPFYVACQLTQIDTNFDAWLEKHCPEHHITIDY